MALTKQMPYSAAIAHKAGPVACCSHCALACGVIHCRTSATRWRLTLDSRSVKWVSPDRPAHLYPYCASLCQAWLGIVYDELRMRGWSMRAYHGASIAWEVEAKQICPTTLGRAKAKYDSLVVRLCLDRSLMHSHCILPSPFPRLQEEQKKKKGGGRSDHGGQSQQVTALMLAHSAEHLIIHCRRRVGNVPKVAAKVASVMRLGTASITRHRSSNSTWCFCTAAPALFPQASDKRHR